MKLSHSESFGLGVETLAAARSQLLTDGFCVIDGLMPQVFLQQLQTWSDERLATTEHPAKWKYQGSDIKITGEHHRSKQHPEFPADAIVDRLIEHPAPILDALGIADHISGGVFQIISKPAGAPALYWHQDWARWDDPISLSPWSQQVFLNWYLSDTCAENGCLRVIPGSHRRRLDLHSHLVQAHEAGGYDIQESNEWMFYDHPEAIDVPVRVGQLVIADARLLHATHSNASTQRRTLLLGWYYRKANTPPLGWQAAVPQEIVDRPADFPNQWIREPGRYLRPA